MTHHPQGPVVVAFGGNALLLAGQKGTFAEQLDNVTRTCRQLVPLLQTGQPLVIAHGNGPQVGNVLLQHDAGERQYGIPAQPMDVCGAQTQGSIAYLIETALETVLAENGLRRSVVSLVTRVEVAADDPAFQHPSKPVGPYYSQEEAQRLHGSTGAEYREDPRGRGWRKVVPSPVPVRIEHVDLVGQLAREGHIVVTAGGGGIPIVRDGSGVHGVEAVIDKDLASALCATEIGAEAFYILTDVEKACLNFHRADERPIDVMTLAQAEAYLAEGQFAEGSMAPKVRAGIRFVRHSGRPCIITEARALSRPQGGTRIIP